MEAVKFLVTLALVFLLVLGIGALVVDPILGLTMILLSFVLLTFLFEPASGKAMLKLFLPVIILLVVLNALTKFFQKLSVQQAVLVAIVVFFLFVLAGSMISDVKSSLVLAFVLTIPTFIAVLADPTGKLAIAVSSVLMIVFLSIVWFLTRKLGEPLEVRLPERYGQVIEVSQDKLRVKLGGEIWWAIPAGWKFTVGDYVYAEEIDGLKLRVVPVVICPSCGQKYPVTRAPERCTRCGTSLVEEIFRIFEEKRAK